VQLGVLRHQVRRNLVGAVCKLEPHDHGARRGDDVAAMLGGRDLEVGEARPGRLDGELRRR
jgi:hypothetical protein